MAVPGTAASTPRPPSATSATTPSPLKAARQEAKKRNKRVEIPSYRSETSTTFANPDGKTLYTELYSTPIRVQKNGTWHPVDTTLVEEGGIIRPRAVKGEFALSAGGDTAVVTTTDDKGQAALSADTRLPRPHLAGDTATYPSAYGPGIDLVVTATPTGLLQKLVIRKRPTSKTKPSLRIPVDLPKGMRYGKDSSGKPALMAGKAGKSDKKVVSLGASPMLDAAAARHPDTGHTGTATVTTEQNGDEAALLLTPDAAFLADPAVAYPVTVALASDTWTGTGVAGDTFVSTSYPNGDSNNINYQRIIAGKSNGGTVTWRAYIDFNIKDTPLEGGTVDNADLRLWNFRANACTSEINSGVVARRITADWTVTDLTWNNQPQVTTGGQVGNKGAYSDDCPRGEGELYYSIETMVQAWMDGAPDHGVQLSSASEGDSTNWRWYRSYEYGGYDGYPGQPRGPVLFISYTPALIPDPPEPISWFKAGEGFAESATDEEIRAITHSSASPVEADDVSDAEADLMQAEAPEFAENLGRVLVRPSDVSEELWHSLNPNSPESDPDEPTVISTVPHLGATDVQPDVQVQARFSEPVTGAQITVTDESGQAIQGTPTVSPTGDVITFTPAVPLPLDTLLMVKVEEARDADGHTLPTPYSWSFTTASSTPTPTPTATTTNPPGEQRTVSLPVQMDTWIDNQGSTGPDAFSLWAGAYGSSDPRVIEQTYLKFDTSSLVGKAIVDARLELWNHASYGCGDSGSGIKVQKVISDWSASTLNWSNKPSETSSGESVATDPGGCTGTPPEDVAWTWPVTSMVQTWASGENNYGLLLRGIDESATAPLYDRGFHSSELNEPNSHPPTLKVTYIVDAGGTPFTAPAPGEKTTTSNPPPLRSPKEPTETEISPTAPAMSGRRPVVDKLWTRPFITKNNETVTSTTTPHLMVRVANPLRRHTTVSVEVTHDPKASSHKHGLIWSGTSESALSGPTTALRVPEGKLSNDWKVRWRARITSDGIHNSWSAWQAFTVKSPTTPPSPEKRRLVPEDSEKAEAAQQAAGDTDFTYERINNPAECRALTGPKAYTAKNSYNWCLWGEIGSRTKWYHNNRFVGSIKYTARVTLIAHSFTGNNKNDQAREAESYKSRQFKVFFYLDQINRKGYAPPALLSAAQAAAETFPFVLGLGFKPKNCSVEPRGLNDFIYKNIDTWQAEGGNFTFTSDANNFPAPDHVGRCSLKPQVHFQEQIKDPYGHLMTENPVFRCDSSPKIKTSKGGCVVWKGGRPVFQLSKSAQIRGPGNVLMTNPVRESAQHIWDAWNNPNNTYPLDSNKQIPGFSFSNPLERNTDTSRKGLGGQNRKVAIKQCDTSFSDPRPRPPGLRYTRKLRDPRGNIIWRSCDEFPFAASHQGAFKAGTNYSARPILATDNSTSGSWLGWWFERNRVLEKQKFTVTILDTQTSGINGYYPPPGPSPVSDESLVPDSEAP